MWICIFLPPLLYPLMNYKDDERQLLSKAKEKENKAIQVGVIPVILNL